MTKEGSNFPAAVLSKEESGSRNIVPNGDSQTLTSFLGFLGCSSFFLRIFDVEAIFFPLSNFLNAKMHSQNALKAPTDRPQHFAQIFIAAPMKSHFHSTKMKKEQPLDWPQ